MEQNGANEGSENDKDDNWPRPILAEYMPYKVQEVPLRTANT